jgi:c-di-GMP-binding flagellar brake protein YcgR
MVERRRYMRIPENLPLVYEIVPGGTEKENIAKDISQSGMRFLINEFVPKDCRLRVKINFKGTLFNFETLVKCMWTRKIPYSDRYEIGVEFLDMPPKAAEYLVSFIKGYLDPGAE